MWVFVFICVDGVYLYMVLDVVCFVILYVFVEDFLWIRVWVRFFDGYRRKKKNKIDMLFIRNI